MEQDCKGNGRHFRHEDFFGQHFGARRRPRIEPFTNTVRSKTTLEETADLTLHVDQYDSQDGIQCYEAHADRSAHSIKMANPLA